MRKLILLFLISISFSQYFGGNLQLGGAFPKGEFMDQDVPNALALDFNVKYYLKMLH